MPVMIDEITSQVSVLPAEQPLSPELVRKITELVYAMLLEEIRIDRERCPNSTHKDVLHGRR